MGMIFRAAGFEKNSIVDGPGMRYVIFFQGCLHHCEGCHNPETWPVLGGNKYDMDNIKKEIAKDPMISGITLSGGEPFLQPRAVLDICVWAKQRKLSVWCYTGYDWEQLIEWEDARKDILKYVDVIVDGEFKKDELSLDISWRGSRNQRLIDVQASLKKGEVVLYET